MAIDIPVLAKALTALNNSTLGQVQVTMRKARDDLQTKLLDATDAGEDTTDLASDFTLLNTWIRALDAAVQPTPPPNAATDLLNTMRAVDRMTSYSTALNNLLIAVDGIVKAAKG